MKKMSELTKMRRDCKHKWKHLHDNVICLDHPEWTNGYGLACCMQEPSIDKKHQTVGIFKCVLCGEHKTVKGKIWKTLEKAEYLEPQVLEKIKERR